MAEEMEAKKPVVKRNLSHEGRCWGPTFSGFAEDGITALAGGVGLYDRACDRCRADEERPYARWKCPRCGQGLLWKSTAGRVPRASCCRMPWVMGSDQVPVRAWGCVIYMEKRLDTYHQWGHKDKRPEEEEVA